MQINIQAQIKIGMGFNDKITLTTEDIQEAVRAKLRNMYAVGESEEIKVSITNVQTSQ